MVPRLTSPGPNSIHCKPSRAAYLVLRRQAQAYEHTVVSPGIRVWDKVARGRCCPRRGSVPLRACEVPLAQST
jgi:hypothetical protein